MLQIRHFITEMMYYETKTSNNEAAMMKEGLNKENRMKFSKKNSMLFLLED